MNLIEAVKKNNVAEVKELVKAEDVNLKDKYGCNALYYAAELGNSEVVDILLAAKIKVNEQNILGATPLMRTVIRGNNEIVRKLLKAGADPNTSDKDGYTSVHMAALKSNLELLELLVEYGGEIKARTNYDSTILHCAATGITEESEDWKLVEWLLGKGIDPYAKNKSGLSVRDLFYQKDWSYAKHYEELVSSLGESE